MDFDFSTIIYIIIAILFSIFSGKKKAKKNAPQQDEEEYEEQETSLEDEIRKMAERMTGKTETPKEEPKPEYKTEEKRPQYATPYERYDNKTNYDRDIEPLEKIPSEPVTDYSVDDIEALRKYNESLKAQKYATTTTNLESRAIDSLAKGKELHTVMNKKEDEIGKSITAIDEKIDASNFDGRKAFIYSEIFKRPEY
jgi:FtsZ-interacting cell division protein ZipA